MEGTSTYDSDFDWVHEALQMPSSWAASFFWIRENCAQKGNQQSGGTVDVHVRRLAPSVRSPFSTSESRRAGFPTPVLFCPRRLPYVGQSHLPARNETKNGLQLHVIT